MRHNKFWNTYPQSYIIADIHNGMLDYAKSVFERENISYDSFLISRNEKLPVKKILWILY